MRPGFAGWSSGTSRRERPFSAPCGTTGESPTLSHEEHERVIALVIEAAAGRARVMAGTGSNSTAEAIRLTRFAARAGADAALSVAPYYNRPNQEGLYRHFAAIAEAVDLPIVLYNIPGRTGRNVEPETVERLAKLGPIVAVKEASGSLDQVSELLARTDLTILSGDDSLDPADARGRRRGGRLGGGQPGARRGRGDDRGLPGGPGRRSAAAARPSLPTGPGLARPGPQSRSRSRRPSRCWAAAATEVRLPLCPLDERALEAVRAGLIRCGLLTESRIIGI